MVAAHRRRPGVGPAPPSKPPSTCARPLSGRRRARRATPRNPTWLAPLRPPTSPSGGPGWNILDHMLPTYLKPGEKRTADLLSDWPWIVLKDLAALLGVSAQRGLRTGQPPWKASASSPGSPGADASPSPTEGSRCWPAGDRTLRWHCEEAVERGAAHQGEGLRLAQRVGRQEPPTAPEHRAHRRRPRLRRRPGEAGPSPAPGRSSSLTRPAGRPATSGTTRSCRSSPSRRLRRAAAGQRRMALLPGVGASRRAAGHDVRTPSRRTCATTHRTGPSTTHGVRPDVLIVFDDETAAAHFLRVAREEMQGGRVNVPLWVSHAAAIHEMGPLGRAWRGPGHRESPRDLPPQ